MRHPLRVVAPFAALTLAVSLTLGGTAVAAAGSRGTHVQADRMTGAGRMIGAGRTASRSAVPWSKVGGGWTLVTYTTASPFTSPAKTGATTLYLVDPAGGKYVMHRWPRVPADGGANLVDWSGDGTRAMLWVAKSPTSTSALLDQLTLATGKLTRLRLPASAEPVSYTRPDGQAILADRVLTSPRRVELVRYDLSGKLEKVLFTLKLASINGGFLNDSQSSPYDPSGTEIALTAAPGAVRTEHTVLISNAGGLIRRFSSADSCMFRGWWTASELLTANCTSKRLFLTPVSGGKPTPLTPANSSPYRYVSDAWRLAGHTYVQASGPACGSGSVDVLRNGRLVNLAVPKVSPTIVTASASRLLIVNEKCMGSSGLVWFNPTGSTEDHVLRQNQGQGVINWVPFYRLGRG